MDEKPPDIIGLISDSHGAVKRTRAAVELLRQHGAEVIIHLGDIGSEEVLEELLGAPARFVMGNCDDHQRLAHYAQILGIPCDHPCGTLRMSRGILAYAHGDVPEILLEAVERAKPSVVAHGHTHEVRDEVLNGLHVVNPGALSRARRYTAALFHASEDRLEIIQVPDGDG